MTADVPHTPDPGAQPPRDPYRPAPEVTAVFPRSGPPGADLVPLPGAVPVHSPATQLHQPVTYGSAYHPAAYHPAAYPPRRTTGGGHVAVAWIVAVLTLGYMLPWAVAATRNKSNTLPIALVNLLVGWTFVGWVAALVMACLSEPSGPAHVATYVQVNTPGPAAAPPPGWYPDGSGALRYWDGRAWTASTQP